MSLPRTINSTQMRQVNRSAVLDLVRRASPLSRSEIALKLGLSLPTVMRIIEDLLEEDLVRFTGATEHSRGRRREMLEYHRDGSLVIGVDLGGTKMFGALANIGGEILQEAAVESHGAQGEQAFETLAEMIQQLVNSPAVAARPLRGFAIGAPGFAYHQAGIVRWAPALEWRDYPLKARLEQRFSMPVFVDNDVNLAVLGEYWFGANQGVRNLALITIGTGVGAGLIMDGQLYRGGHEAAGEVGYMLPGVEFLGQRYDGFGALESAVSGAGIARRARVVLANRLPEEQIQAVTARDVFAAARQGQPWAISIVAETVDLLALTIANISALLDPEVVLLGGGVADSADLLLEPLRHRLEGLVPCPPRIEASELGRRAAIMGAIALSVSMTTGVVG